MAKEQDIVLKEHLDGNIYVDDMVLRQVAVLASREVDGVGTLSTKFLDVFSSKNKNVRIQSEEENLLHLEVSISVLQGFKMYAVAENVQDTIRAILKDQLQIEKVAISVVIRELMLEEIPDEEEFIHEVRDY